MLLFGLGPQSSPLDATAAFYRSLEPCAITVDVQAKSQGATTGFRYHVFRRGQAEFRVELETSLPDGTPGERYTVWSDGRRLIAFAERANRYVENAWTPESSRSANFVAVFGQLEPFMTVLLDPVGGVKAFTDRLGASTFRDVGGRVIGEIGDGQNSVLAFSLSEGGAIAQVTLETQGEPVAAWRVSPALQSLADALNFVLPVGATRVRSLSGGEPPPPEYEPGAKNLVDRSVSAFASLNSISYRATSYLFAGGESERRTANCWWERGGRFRYAATVAGGASAEALYDGKSLLAFDRVSRTGFRGRLSRKSLLDVLAAVDCPLDGMSISLTSGTSIWTRLAPLGSKVRVRQSMATPLLDVIEAQTPDGWSALVFMRKSDGLIERIERTQILESKVSISETVIFQITSVNTPIPARAWAFSLPAGVVVKPLPQID